MGCSSPSTGTIILALIGVFHVVFEYWVGKTRKVKASSALELAITGVSILGRLILRRR